MVGFGPDLVADARGGVWDAALGHDEAGLRLENPCFVCPIELTMVLSSKNHFALVLLLLSG